MFGFFSGAVAKLIAIAVLMAAITGSYWYAYKAGERHQVGVQIVAQAAADKEAVMRYDKIEGELLNVQTKQKVVYKTIYKQVDKIIDRPVYSNNCIDDSGRMLLNAALSGSDPAKSVTAVPESDNVPK